jgi:hypothetical protein
MKRGMKRHASAYNYAAGAIDELLLLRCNCLISIHSEELLRKAEKALEELINSLDA